MTPTPEAAHVEAGMLGREDEAKPDEQTDAKTQLRGSRPAEAEDFTASTVGFLHVCKETAEAVTKGVPVQQPETGTAECLNDSPYSGP